MGLLGGSITLAAQRCISGVKTTGFTHRPITRRKARQLEVADRIVNSLTESVRLADLVILATPICTFKQLFIEMADDLPDGCIVTDVGSTKLLPHRWAAKHLPKRVYYAGSHPIAGSEQRGVEFARDDLFDTTDCIITKTASTNKPALYSLKKFWSALGCSVRIMSPAQHDRIFAAVSHLPHITAAALVNAASKLEQLKFAGKGFIDTSRIASGPANIWADVLLTNANNTAKGIDKTIAELAKFKKTIKAGNRKQLEKLLQEAKIKRSALIKYKMNAKEIIS